MTSANGRSNGLAAAGLFGNYARVMAETVDLPGRDALRLDERTPRRAGDATGNGPTLAANISFQLPERFTTLSLMKARTLGMTRKGNAERCARTTTKSWVSY